MFLRGSVNNIPALVQIMAWRWPGDKLLSEPMMVILLIHNASVGLNPEMISGKIDRVNMIQYFEYYSDDYVTALTIPWICYERSVNAFHLSI